MTTWTIKVAHPTQQAGGAGFNAALSDTGLRFDDTVALKAWMPAGSTSLIRLQRLLGALENDDDVGFKYFAFDGAATTVAADLSGTGIRQES